MTYLYRTELQTKEIFINDLALFSQGYLTNTLTYHTLESTPLLKCEEYFNTFAGLFMTIILTNSLKSK